MGICSDIQHGVSSSLLFYNVDSGISLRGHVMLVDCLTLIIRCQAYSELGISRVISTFCGIDVTQNATIARKIPRFVYC